MGNRFVAQSLVATLSQLSFAAEAAEQAAAADAGRAAERTARGGASRPARLSASVRLTRTSALSRVFVTRTSDPEPDEVRSGKPFARIRFGGAYFFLYPSLQHLRDQTGQLIDPQMDAFFDGPALSHLDSLLSAVETLTAAQPETWQQRVGTSAAGDVLYETTSRHEVAQLIAGLRAAVLVAQQRRCGVLFHGA